MAERQGAAVRRRGDRLMFGIFVCLLLLAAGLYLYRHYAARPDVLRVEISQDGKTLKRFDLKEDTGAQEFVFESAYGRNVVRAQGRGVAIVDADCPDKDCVRMGRLTRPGDSAVCLPHRLVLRILGTGGVDAVTF